MPSEISLPLFVKLRFDLERIAVRDWATVSAMPPRTCSTSPTQYYNSNKAKVGTKDNRSVQRL